MTKKQRLHYLLEANQRKLGWAIHLKRRPRHLLNHFVRVRNYLIALGAE